MTQLTLPSVTFLVFSCSLPAFGLLVAFIRLAMHVLKTLSNSNGNDKTTPLTASSASYA